MIRSTLLACLLLLGLTATGGAQPTPPSDDPMADLLNVERQPSDPNKAAVYGYFAFGLFAVGALFVVCKSARRG